VQSERSEEALISKSLFMPLQDRNIALSIIMYDTKIQKEPNAKKIFRDFKIPFQTLSSFRTKNVIDILVREKPDAVLMIVDIGPIPRAFVIACQRLKIPFIVTAVDVQSKIASVEQNATKLLKLVFSRISRLPNMAKMYLYYFRTKIGVNPTLIMNVPDMSLEFLRDITDPIAGQSSEYILTATPSDAVFLRRNCLQTRLIKAVGNPLFDSSILKDFESTKPAEVKAEVQNIFGIPTSKKIVIVLSGAQLEHGLWTEEQKLTFYNQMFESFEEFRSKIFVVIKLHPAESNIFSKIWKDKYDDYIKISRFDLGKLIWASDIVITWFSRAMIDVLIARKPLILVDFFGDRKRFNLLNETENIIEQNISINVFKKDDLKKTLSNIIEDESFRRQIIQIEDNFYSKNLFLMDGKSSERIAETVRTIIDRRRISKK